MVKVYIEDFTRLPDPKDRKELMVSLNAERRLRIAKAASEKARRECLGSALMLNAVLGEHGFNPNDVKVNAYGKPEIEGLHFNLSHSGNFVVCAVSDHPVGCDIERLREAPRKVSNRFFSEHEKQWLESLGGVEFDHAFFRLWTMKESYVKMVGVGMRLPFHAFEIRMDESVSVYREGEKQQCFLQEYEVPGYRLTVCARESEFEELAWKRLI